MADAEQNPQEDFAEDAPSGLPSDVTEAEQAAPAPAAAPEVTSPLIKFINALAGGKKPLEAAKSAVPAAKGKAARPAAPQPAAPVVKAPPKPGAKVPMPGGPLVTIVTRNEFYRDGFRNMLRLVVLQAVIIIGMAISIILFISTQSSQDRYFATTADGRIMQLTPLDQPNMPEAALLSWVAQAATETMTFGHHNYQRSLQQSSRHFTHHGWETFTAALNQSHIIDGMLAGRQDLSAAPRSAPILKQEGVVNGKYRWIVTLPLQVRYEGESSGRNDNLNVTLVIERVPSLENPNGVGIEQWISTQF